MGILSARLAKSLRELADKLAPEPLGIYVYFDGDPVPDDARATICIGPRETPEENQYGTESEILQGRVEMSPVRGEKKPMSREAVAERWRTAALAFPGTPGYQPSKMDMYAEKHWPGHLIDAGLIVKADAEKWNATIPVEDPEDQAAEADTPPVPAGSNPTVN